MGPHITRMKQDRSSLMEYTDAQQWFDVILV
jgi:hypothetical protein